MGKFVNAPVVTFAKFASAVLAAVLGVIFPELLLSTALGGTLDDVRSAVRQEDPSPQPPKEKKRKPPPGNHYHSRSDDDDDNDSLLGLMINDVASAFWSSCWQQRGDVRYHYDANADRWLSADDDVARVTLPAEPDMYFTRYPYADGWHGYMMHENWVPARPRTVRGRVSLEYGTDFDDISRWDLKLLGENYGGWGLDCDWNLYVEQLAGGRTDSLHVGDMNLLYRVLEAPRMQGRIGIGMNWLVDSRQTDLGINGTFKLDFYARRPLIFSGEIDYGGLGSATQFHGAITAGAIWDRVEFFGGYDYRKIGPVELEGPLIGLRLWF